MLFVPVYSINDDVLLVSVIQLLTKESEEANICRC